MYRSFDYVSVKFMIILKLIHYNNLVIYCDATLAIIFIISRCGLSDKDYVASLSKVYSVRVHSKSSLAKMAELLLKYGK